MGVFYLWGLYMDRYAMMSRKKEAWLCEKTKTSTGGNIHVPKRASFRRSVPDFPSHPDTAGIAARVESPRYTGTLSEVSVQCTNPMRYQLSTKKK